MTEPPEAREVTLRKYRPLAPPFHRHIVRSKLLGTTCKVGDRAVVYDVVATLPEGTVCITENTVFRFQ